MQRLNALLVRVWRTPISVKADYARSNAVIVGMAASLYMITTKIDTALFASQWHITPTGLSWLKEQETK